MSGWSNDPGVGGSMFQPAKEGATGGGKGGQYPKIDDFNNAHPVMWGSLEHAVPSLSSIAVQGEEER